MTIFEFTLMGVTGAGLALIWRQTPRWLNLLPFGIACLAAVQLAIDGYNPNLLPIYLANVAVCLIAGRRLVRRRPPLERKRGRMMLVLGVFGTLLGILALFLAVRATLYQNLPPADLSREGWSEAFEEAHKILERRYAFGDWKQIDWPALHDQTAPQVAAAESAGDRQAYYRAVLGYVSSIPDGHVWLEGGDLGCRQAAIGAGYGLSLLALDDGSVIVVTLTPDGPAEMAGMQWGAQVLLWGGRPAGFCHSLPAESLNLYMNKSL